MGLIISWRRADLLEASFFWQSFSHLTWAMWQFGSNCSPNYTEQLGTLLEPKCTSALCSLEDVWSFLYQGASSSLRHQIFEGCFSLYLVFVWNWSAEHVFCLHFRNLILQLVFFKMYQKSACYIPSHWSCSEYERLPVFLSLPCRGESWSNRCFATSEIRMQGVVLLNYQFNYIHTGMMLTLESVWELMFYSRN